MKMKQVLTPLAYMLSVIGLTFLVVNSFSVITPISSSTSLSGQGQLLVYQSAVCVYHNGVEINGCEPNLFTNKGRNMTRQALMFGNNYSVQFMALAQNLVAQGTTDTSLDGEFFNSGLERTNYTSPQNQTSGLGCSPSNCPGNWTISYQWTNTNP